MTEQKPEIDWSKTTWEGSRREQLRQWCQLSLRERLQAVEDMGDFAQQFQKMRRDGRLRPTQNNK